MFYWIIFSDCVVSVFRFPTVTCFFVCFVVVFFLHPRNKIGLVGWCVCWGVGWGVGDVTLESLCPSTVFRSDVTVLVGWAYNMSRFGLAVRRYRLVSRGTSVRIRFGSPFSSKVVVCGHCLVTLSLVINETLKWLSSLLTLMQESFWW